MNITRHCLVAIGLALASPASYSADLRDGAVYLMTNQPDNAVIAFERAPNGALTEVGTFPTGGAGDPSPVPDSGDPPTDPLASQGSLSLSPGGSFLFALNAGSHEITVFGVLEDGLELKSKRSVGDLRPISADVHGNLMYILNDGVAAVGRAAASLVAFRVSGAGTLTLVPDSKRTLAGGTLTDPAQVAFSPNGAFLVVTDKLNNLIYSFPVDAEGLTGPPTITPSSGTTPFGFEFDGRGHLVIAEAAEGVTGESTVSSYSVQGGGALGSISAAVPNSQTAACWIAVTPNRRYVYVSNTESGQVSSYRLRPDGSIELLESTASNTPAASSPIDLAVSRDGQNLYVHQAGRQAIAVFGIEADGQLTRRRPITDLPSGAQGLAVY